MAELVDFAPVKDGGGTRGLPILDQKLQGKVQRGGIRDRIGGGFHTDSWRNFGIFVRIVNPALSDLVEDRTQSGAVLGLKFSRSILHFSSIFHR